MAVLMSVIEREFSVTDRDVLWKAEIERDIGELRTDVATIKANDANTLKELRVISDALIELRKAINVRTPIWPALTLGLAGLSLIGAIGLVVISPMNADLAELRTSYSEQGTELKELYYSLGKVEAQQEQSE
jgi:hypothetical protein